MKFAIVFAALFTIATAAVLPGSPESLATVEIQQADISPDLSQYSFSSKTSNGISASEQGTLVQAKSPETNAAYVVRGEFSWPAPDGQIYTVRYTADADGFHPEATHLPVAPAA